jgi:hypothetical protein
VLIVAHRAESHSWITPDILRTYLWTTTDRSAKIAEDTYGYLLLRVPSDTACLQYNRSLSHALCPHMHAVFTSSGTS